MVNVFTATTTDFEMLSFEEQNVEVQTDIFRYIDGLGEEEFLEYIGEKNIFFHFEISTILKMG